MRSTSLIISAAVLSSTLAGGSAYAMPSQAHNNTLNKHSHKTVSKKSAEHRYTLCHATNSATNPYVKITVDYDSIVKNHGHDGHDGVVATSQVKAHELKSQKQSWGDVIPPIREHGFAGQNYTTAGQKLLDNDCAMPTVHSSSTDQTDCDNEKNHEQKHDDKKDTPKPHHDQKDDCDTDKTPVGGKGSVDTPNTPTKPQPATPASVSTPVSAAGIATELPETGPSALASLALYIAGATATALTYGGQFIRKSLFSR